ncbi:MAG: imidazole glycerol phosphate synthase cyclase subunit [Gallionellaceae bacterium]|nr:imidazole glycerol phosphate synthase cyclase subunit [Gallionellaceae bacterium]
MLKKRLIPVLLLQNGQLVRSEKFTLHQVIGNPIHEVERFNHWSVDELIYLDISRDDHYDLRRDDKKVRGLSSSLEILTEVSKTCFMPLTWGGRIRSLEQMQAIFAAGADKITLNTQAWREPALITEAARRYGSQAVVVSIDARRHPDGRLEVCVEGGREATGMAPEDWARKVEALGAGEILLQSIDRDGTARGYDLDLIQRVAAATRIPVIALGGVGDFMHYAKGIEAGASAVAAANLWHFKELADRGGKRALARAGVAVRM